MNFLPPSFLLKIAIFYTAVLASDDRSMGFIVSISSKFGIVDVDITNMAKARLMINIKLREWAPMYVHHKVGSKCLFFGLCLFLCA